MARDRQRAKQRKARREPTPPKRGDGDGIAPDARPLHRENVPGPVEHTGDVDQFEASLVAGAGGQTDPDPDSADRASTGIDDDEPAGLVDDERVALGDGDGNGDDGGDRGDDRPVDLADGDDDGRELALAATGRSSDSAPAPAARAASTPDTNASGRGGGRFLNFLRASWAELQRVQWPDRRQVGQATLVVLGFVLIAGAFLGFADYVANELVEFII
ncbi:MAG TPA: preprotein translocase subunit SecE [Solirubrobacteraceae bacterium]|nr:preprotein translocase subunit SecE [Solirubrobacteraceae bacterium]